MRNRCPVRSTQLLSKKAYSTSMLLSFESVRTGRPCCRNRLILQLTPEASVLQVMIRLPESVYIIKTVWSHPQHSAALLAVRISFKATVHIVILDVRPRAMSRLACRPYLQFRSRLALLVLWCQPCRTIYSSRRLQRFAFSLASIPLCRPSSIQKVRLLRRVS